MQWFKLKIVNYLQRHIEIAAICPVRRQAKHLSVQ